MDARNDDAGPDRILLIDLDNCPHELFQLAETVDRYRLVVACYGGREPRVPLNLVPILGELISSGRIEVVSMPAGKNAADFGLTFWAGRLSALADINCEFHIASGDRDLDFAVKSLKDAGHKAKRISGAAKVPVSERNSKVEDSRLRTSVRHLCQVLSRMLQCLPRKKKSLANHVRSCGGKHDLQAALEYLERHGVISYGPHDAVVFDRARLNSYAKMSEIMPSPVLKTLVVPEEKRVPLRIGERSSPIEPAVAQRPVADRNHRQLRFPFDDPVDA